MDMKLELVPIPVADVDRAKAFSSWRSWASERTWTCGPPRACESYSSTPPGSACSISIGTGLPVDEEFAPGVRPGTPSRCSRYREGASRASEPQVWTSPQSKTSEVVRYAGFADPDGDTFTLQEMDWRTGGNFEVVLGSRAPDDWQWTGSWTRYPDHAGNGAISARRVLTERELLHSRHLHGSMCRLRRPGVLDYI